MTQMVLVSDLVDWSIRATLLLAVVLLIARMLEFRSATIAHRTIVAMLAGILIPLPMCMAFVPGWQWKLPPMQATASGGTEVAFAAPPRRTAAFPGGRPDRLDSLGPDEHSIEAAESSSTADDKLPLEIATGSAAAGAAQESAASRLGIAGRAAPNPAQPRWPLGQRQWLTTLWLLGSGVLFMQTLLCFVQLRKFVDRCSPGPAGLVDQIDTLARRGGLKRRVCVRVSGADRMPMACWLLRWTIVVPKNLTTWPRELQETTLLHELGHIARRDAWSDLLARSVVCLLWPSPIAWIAARQTRRLRERACDEWSLQNSSYDAKRYALSLVEVVQRCQGPVHRVASAMADTRGFEARLKWLVTAARPQRPRRFAGGSVLLGVLVVVIVVATAAPHRTTRGGEQGQRAAADAESPTVAANREPAQAQPSISVAGTVIDLSGQPLTGASVALYADTKYADMKWQSVNERWYDSDHELLAKTTTDDRGRFRFTRIAIPPRMVRVIEQLQGGEPAAHVVSWKQGYAVQWQMVQAIDAADQEFRLAPRADVSGIVVDEQGNPLAEAELVVAGLTSNKDNLESFLPHVTIHGAGIQDVPFRAAVRDGRFSLANMPKGHHIVVHCRSPTGHWAAFLIDTGDDTTGAAEYRDRDGNTVAVHRAPIRATARQYPWVRVSVLDHQGKSVTDGGLSALNANGVFGGSARIGADGVAILTVHEPGVYRLIYWTDIPSRRLRFVQSVDVQPGDPETVVIQLPQPHWVAGKVVDGDTGEPVPGVQVTAGPVPPWETTSRVTGATSVTGTDGRFELPTTEGPQRILFTEDVYGYFTPTYRNSEHVNVTPDFPELTVSAEHVPRDLVIRIARGLVIDGRVLDPQGRPEQNARVLAISDEKSLNRQKVVYTDADGRFRFAGLSPYVSTRIATVSDTGAAEQVIAAAADQPWEKSRRESVTLRITPKTSLVGRVIRQGDPVEGVKVRLQREEPIDRGGFRRREWRRRLWDETVTDDQGRYRLRGLSEGDRFTVEFQRPAKIWEYGGWQRSKDLLRTVHVEDGSTIEVPDAELIDTE